MRPKSIVLLLLALGCGLVASIGISQVMESHKNQGEGAGEMLPILVAVADINPNDKFSPETIKLIEWPKSKIPNGALTKFEDLDGKHIRGKIYGGQPILAAMLAGANDIVDAAGQIPKGYVVCAVPVNAVSAGGSLIRPGDRVDVLVYMSRNDGVGIKETQTRTILQDISVFAVDNAFVGKDAEKGDQASNAKTVSLLVTLSQAEKVTLASEMGSIRLVLRSSGDSEHSASTGATVPSLVSGSEKGNADAEQVKDNTNKELLDFLNSQKTHEPAVVEQPKTAPWKMVVLRGNETKEVEFPDERKLPEGALNDDSTGSGPNDDSTGAGTDNDVAPPTLPDDSKVDGDSSEAVFVNPPEPGADLPPEPRE